MIVDHCTFAVLFALVPISMVLGVDTAPHQCAAQPLYQHGFEPPVDLDCITQLESQKAFDEVMHLKHEWIRQTLGSEQTQTDLSSKLKRLFPDHAHKLYEMTLGPNVNYNIPEDAPVLNGWNVTFMHSQFGWLFDKVKATLRKQLGDHVSIRPGSSFFFRILSGNETVDPTVRQILKMIPSPGHYDGLWTVLDWPEGVTFEHTISFTLPIAMPRGGHGLKIFERYRHPLTQEYHHYVTKEVLTPEERDKPANSYIHPYHIGKLSLHSGNEFHSVAEFRDVQPDDWRITLQGWGVFVPNQGWELFG